MMGEKKTAAYRIISDVGGNRYKFFCDLSGGLVCTTEEIYRGDTPEQELLLAWEKEGKKQFNTCFKCGKLVADVMFNPEVCECVKCAPFEAQARFCKTCGAKVEAPGRNCPTCGNLLNYEGGAISYDAENTLQEFGAFWLWSECDEEKQSLCPVR